MVEIPGRQISSLVWRMTSLETPRHGRCCVKSPVRSVEASRWYWLWLEGKCSCLCLIISALIVKTPKRDTVRLLKCGPYFTATQSWWKPLKGFDLITHYAEGDHASEGEYKSPIRAEVKTSRIMECFQANLLYGCQLVELLIYCSIFPGIAVLEWVCTCGWDCV